jgi:hypothetical protein
MTSRYIPSKNNRPYLTTGLSTCPHLLTTIVSMETPIQCVRPTILVRRPTKLLAVTIRLSLADMSPKFQFRLGLALPFLRTEVSEVKTSKLTITRKSNDSSIDRRGIDYGSTCSVEPVSWEQAKGFGTRSYDYHVVSFTSGNGDQSKDPRSQNEEGWAKKIIESANGILR